MAKIKIYLVNEYMTSKKCHLCENELSPYLYRTNPNKKKDKFNDVNEKKMTYGLLRHEETVKCKMQYQNRDKNAAKNMLKIVHNVIEKGERPEALRRTPEKVVEPQEPETKQSQIVLEGNVETSATDTKKVVKPKTRKSGTTKGKKSGHIDCSNTKDLSCP